MLAKNILYHSGIFHLYHCYRNKKTLSVAMFHRVLPEGKAKEMGADPLWTITPDILSEVIRFFQKHYNIISLKHIQDYVYHGTGLPERALLLTFDDGWRDNYLYDLPLLKSLHCPAVLYIVAGCIGRKKPFWQERIFAAWKKGILKNEAIEHWIEDLGCKNNEKFEGEGEKIRYIIRQFSKNYNRKIDGQLEKYAGKKINWAKREMLSIEEIDEMRQRGIDIGAHGFTHTPLSRISEEKCIEEFEKIEKCPLYLQMAKCSVKTLSFPHGAYNSKNIDIARNFGYKLFFSSDSIINELEGYAKEKKRIFGRIVIDRESICDQDGRINAALLARHVMFQPKKAISVKS